MALSAYEGLARVSVFLEQARYDEDRYESEETSYAQLLQEIEEQAMYWLLCEIQKLIYRWVVHVLTALWGSIY